MAAAAVAAEAVAAAGGSTAAGVPSEPLLRVEGLRKYFPSGGGRFGGRSEGRSGGRSDRRSDGRSGGRSDGRSGGRSDGRQGGRSGGPAGWVRAVDGVSFELYRGETLGLVGESGCGKTTTGRTILRLTPATGGRVRFDGRDVFTLPAGPLRRLRREMQMVFQDPHDALDPRMTVAEIVAEPLAIHGAAGGRARRERVRELLELVGLGPHQAHLYPHECSGGQRQRVGIARALALSPKLVVCDEPVSSLDVSVQAQVLGLLDGLQRRFALAYLFIAHNMAVVRQVSDRVAVMYLGRLVELAPGAELYDHPAHPYTEALLAAAPLPDPAPGRGRRTLLDGEPPSALDPPRGCRFHPRCPHAFEPCALVEPELREVVPGHLAACHLHGPAGPATAAGDGRVPGSVAVADGGEAPGPATAAGDGRAPGSVAVADGGGAPGPVAVAAPGGAPRSVTATAPGGAPGPATAAAEAGAAPDPAVTAAAPGVPPGPATAPGGAPGSATAPDTAGPPVPADDDEGMVSD